MSWMRIIDRARDLSPVVELSITKHRSSLLTQWSSMRWMNPSSFSVLLHRGIAVSRFLFLLVPVSSPPPRAVV